MLGLNPYHFHPTQVNQTSAEICQCENHGIGLIADSFVPCIYSKWSSSDGGVFMVLSGFKYYEASYNSVQTVLLHPKGFVENPYFPFLFQLFDWKNAKQSVYNFSFHFDLK